MLYILAVLLLFVYFCFLLLLLLFLFCLCFVGWLVFVGFVWLLLLLPGACRVRAPFTHEERGMRHSEREQLARASLCV